MDHRQITQTMTGRVLVFRVDDGRFCIHADWVDAIYPRKEVTLHTLKGADGSVQQFIIHRGQPAWVMDLRQAFGLDEVLGIAERPAFAVVRSGSAFLAVRVDEFTGVRELDLTERSPVASAVVRDGGQPVGHLVEFDGELHVLLDPNRILSNTLRDALDPLLEEALAFRDRQAKLERLVPELRRHCTPSGLKAYARLTRRNGLARASSAARTVLAIFEQPPAFNGGVEGNLGGDKLLRDLLALVAAHQSGTIRIQSHQGSGSIFLHGGDIFDAEFGQDRGHAALKELLALREGTYSFDSSAAPPTTRRIPDSPAWVLTEIVEQLTEERRVKHLRDAN
ncbi:MAG: chemotaxis protein CheW [Candidatus Binatia bacterium]|nr:chemotaxis protein CheW [Candidatus Binatia bacterium]